MKSGLTDGLNAQTVDGATVQLAPARRQRNRNDANIIVPDMEASNGVIPSLKPSLSPPDEEAATDSTRPLPRLRYGRFPLTNTQGIIDNLPC
ncbi:MAG: hypothetical protein H6645_04970 [Caldilineaceae bacterium]|nr:hypothetical protein [Caldilineaceae bacterium]